MTELTASVMVTRTFPPSSIRLSHPADSAPPCRNSSSRRLAQQNHLRGSPAFARTRHLVSLTVADNSTSTSSIPKMCRGCRDTCGGEKKRDRGESTPAPWQAGALDSSPRARLRRAAHRRSRAQAPSPRCAEDVGRENLRLSLTECSATTLIIILEGVLPQHWQ